MQRLKKEPQRQEKSIINLIDHYIEKLRQYTIETENEVKEILKKQKSNDSKAKYIVGVGVDFIHNEASVRFYKSGIPRNIQLSNKKIDLAVELMTNLEEAKEYMTDSLGVSHSDIAKSTAYFALVAKQKHEKLLKRFKGSAGKLGLIIDNILQRLEQQYSNEMGDAKNIYSENQKTKKQSDNEINIKNKISDNQQIPNLFNLYRKPIASKPLDPLDANNYSKKPS